MDDCHECVLRVSLGDHFGTSDVSCACGQDCELRVVFRKQWSQWMTGVPGWTCDRASCLFSLPRARTQTFAPRLIWQVSESMMSPLVTGWLIGCRNFDRNWWFHFFSSHHFTLHLLVSRWEIRSFHRCQQNQNNNLTLQNEETTTT